MEPESIVDALEAVAIGSVAITNASLSEAGAQALSFEQWRAILVVGEEEDGRRISEVAQRVSVTLPATSRLLRRLERRGLVALEPDPADGRATVCRLTRRGLTLRGAVLDYRRLHMRQVAAVAQFDDASIAAVSRLGDAFRAVRGG
jgi:DNA-binding MarR family transcriptional regulator